MDDQDPVTLDMIRHDMMTPIATAKGAIDLLTRQFAALSEEQRTHLLQAIDRAVGNIERLAMKLQGDASVDSQPSEES